MAGEARKTVDKGAEKGADRGAAKPVAEMEEILPDAPAEKADEGIRRALDAAQAANDAAQDMAELSSAYRSFAEAVMKGQRRNTQIAVGAAMGASVAMVLAGLVYFRSVEDLRIAAAVQAEAAGVLVEEVKQIDGIGDTVEEQQAKMREELVAALHVVKTDIQDAARTAMTPPEGEMEAQIATMIRDGVKTDLDAVRDELMQALAETALSSGSGGLTANEMSELLAGVKLLVDGSGSGPASGGGAARATEPAAGATGQAEPAAGSSGTRGTKPRANPKAAEPNPFAYP